MKKFVISEDERARILSMHESATKRQYLSEQGTDRGNCKLWNVPDNLCGIYRDAYDRLDGGAKKGYYYDWNKYPGMFVHGYPERAMMKMDFYAVYPDVFYGLPSLQDVGSIDTNGDPPYDKFISQKPEKGNLEAADSYTYEGSGLPEMLITNAYKSWFKKYGNNLMAKKDQIFRGNLMSAIRGNKDNKYLNIMRKYFNIDDNA